MTDHLLMAGPFDEERGRLSGGRWAYGHWHWPKHWHYRGERQRVSALRYEAHCDFLHCLTERLSRRLEKLPIGVHRANLFMTRPVSGNSAWELAARIVLAREQDLYGVHRNTEHAILYGRRCPAPDRWMAYCQGRIFIPPETRAVAASQVQWQMEYSWDLHNRMVRDD